jgi:hypothetical protein
MKKLLLLTVLVCLAVGTVSAQGWGNPWGTPREAISVSGTLQLHSGTIAVVSGDKTYFVPALMRLTGFVEGLKEGAQISLDGFAMGNYIQPSKFTVSGKTYDLSATPQGFEYRGYDRGHHDGRRGRGRR